MDQKHIPCPNFRKCGGCQLQNLPYAEQLLHKQRRAVSVLGELGHVENIIGMDEPTHYRNKVHAALAYDRAKNKTISGIYQPGSHRIVPVDECMIEDKLADEIIVDIRRMLPEFKIQVFDERGGSGWLRHILIRRGFATGEVMVVLVAVSPIFKLQKPFLKKLLEKHPEITTVVLNINDRFGPVILGTREKVIYGSGYIEDVLCGKRFRISSRSFYQINPVQTEKLYSAAIDLAGLTGNETVLDAYCGIGTIGLCAAPHAKQVIGVERNPAAVRDAAANARRNKLANARFVCADATEWMMAAAAEGLHPDVVFLDPPRAGSTPECIAAVNRMKPKRIVYVSCDPETLARDVAAFTRLGWRAAKFCPVDLFPQTVHVETVVLLSKGEVDSKKIRVEFSLEDMDMSEFQDGATYPQIKEYVLEHTGLKVSNLYISQIKRKCGIGVGKNYNLPKSEDSRQPQCPQEKEKAIREAFKYFGMI